MKTVVIQLFLPLLFVAPLVYAQSDVYVCMNPDGSRYYENRIDKVQGCKRVDMQAITMIPEPYKKAVAPKPKLWPQLSLGMTKTAVEKVWGKPSLTRRVQTREGLTEEWKYTSHAKLTFRNGTLEIIED